MGSLAGVSFQSRVLGHQAHTESSCQAPPIWVQQSSVLESQSDHRGSSGLLAKTGIERLVKETEEVLSRALNMNIALCS